jgi:enolase
MEIQHIFAQELLDSRGYPTVEVTVCMDLCRRPSGMAPSGTSKGKYEAVELRDDDPDRYLGKGVRQAVRNVNEIIAPALIGLDPTDQWALDQRMIELDGTSNKSHLGANAILAVSIACLRAGACAEEIPLFQRVAELRGRPRDGPFTIPVPLVNLLNGGRHASDSADFQEYMVVPVGAPTIVEAIRWSAEVFHRLKTVIKRKGGPSAVGDEGGFAPPVRSNEEPLRLLVAAIQEAGYLPGEEIALALDVAASELYRNGRYHLKQEGLELTTEELVDLLVEWTERYPHRLHRGRPGPGRLGRIRPAPAEDRKPDSNRRRRPVRHQSESPENGNRARRRQFGPDQGQSDRHHHRDPGDHRRRRGE